MRSQNESVDQFENAVIELKKAMLYQGVNSEQYEKAGIEYEALCSNINFGDASAIPYLSIMTRLKLMPQFYVGDDGKLYHEKVAYETHKQERISELKMERKYLSAKKEYEEIIAQTGLDSSFARVRFLLMLSEAPDWLRSEVEALGRERHEFPSVIGYTDEGRPVVEPGDVARFLRMPVDEYLDWFDMGCREHGLPGIPFTDVYHSIN